MNINICKAQAFDPVAKSWSSDGVWCFVTWFRIWWKTSDKTSGQITGSPYPLSRFIVEALTNSFLNYKKGVLGCGWLVWKSIVPCQKICSIYFKLFHRVLKKLPKTYYEKVTRYLHLDVLGPFFVRQKVVSLNFSIVLTQERKKA